MCQANSRPFSFTYWASDQAGIRLRGDVQTYFLQLIRRDPGAIPGLPGDKIIRQILTIRTLGMQFPRLKRRRKGSQWSSRRITFHLKGFSPKTVGQFWVLDQQEEVWGCWEDVANSLLAKEFCTESLETLVASSFDCPQVHQPEVGVGWGSFLTFNHPATGCKDGLVIWVWAGSTVCPSWLCRVLAQTVNNFRISRGISALFLTTPEQNSKRFWN